MRYHVLEELVSWQVVVSPVRHEMACFGYSQVAEGSVSSVVPSCNISAGLFIPNVVNLPSLSPELVIERDIQFPDPGV